MHEPKKVKNKEEQSFDDTVQSKRCKHFVVVYILSFPEIKKVASSTDMNNFATKCATSFVSFQKSIMHVIFD